MSFIDITEVECNAQDLLATKPTVTRFSDGDYVRWEVELFRRRYERSKKAMEDAEVAFRDACKGGVFTTEEAVAHTAALNAADSRRSITRAALSSLVRNSAGNIAFAKKQDEWTSTDRRCAFEENPHEFCQYATMQATVPGSPEAARNAALLEAEQEYNNDCAEARQDAIEAGCRRIRGTGRSAAERFDERKAAIEDKYYTACLALY